jgi:hypothetical protein
MCATEILLSLSVRSGVIIVRVFHHERRQHMRNLQTLSRAAIDSATGVISFTSEDETALHPVVSMRQEGEYAAISASFGALEIALRPRLPELVRTLRHLQPNDGLSTTRQIGSGNCFLGLGLRTDGALILRPTIVGDATGYFCLNFLLTSEAAAVLRTWLAEDPA